MKDSLRISLKAGENFIKIVIKQLIKQTMQVNVLINLMHQKG